MKRNYLISFLLFLSLSILSSQSYQNHSNMKLGVNAGNGFNDQPTYENISNLLSDYNNYIIGFEMILLSGNTSFSIKYHQTEIQYENTDNRFDNMFIDYLDASAAIEYSYHLFGTSSIIDPFGSINFGTAMLIDTTDYKKYINGYDYPITLVKEDDEILNCSIFSQIGGGLAINFPYFYISSQFLYTFFQTNFMPEKFLPQDVPLYQIEISLGIFIG